MNNIRQSTRAWINCVCVFALASLVALVAAQAVAGQRAPQPISAKIVNTEAEPVPVTGSIRVGNQTENPLPVAGTVSVNNSSTGPLLVRDVDNHSREPFQRRLFVTILPGEGRGTASTQLPDGKMLITEYVSARAGGSSLDEIEYLIVANGSGFEHFLFLTRASPSSLLFQASASIRMHSTGSLHVAVQRVASFAPVDRTTHGVVHVSGWLVNCPTNLVC